ncbi:hypothetical protein [Phycisphaera mikurensis]|uniref:Uncharacterized protein n=1 Tax=Phycisphaera mikurensis (strain NBRC 102666 / KCTC 22515 / FYK2301M01) TaxID=1142394 RepID=I0IGQ1_PHYMF|nr:hypothetical protein [Phycisphaera mikurensis]MBB6443230.1 hypothetical protein [Phycisphaera mikurensis]BAM04439.1 hypothetical protein PSMK_22800 [Phycisphaera mikurensis NBRC 102666]
MTPAARDLAAAPRPPRSPTIRPRLFATSFGLLCFAAALLAGTIAGNASSAVLGRGLVVLLAAYAAGRMLEAAAALALAEGPDADAPSDAGDAAEGPETLPLSAALSPSDEAPPVAATRRAA